MSVLDDVVDLHRLVDERVAQVQIGSGEAELGAALHAVLELCADGYSRGDRSLTIGHVREAIRGGLA